jgi:predicted small secreted protein
MHHRRTALITLLMLVASVMVAACGTATSGGSGNANTLLGQTFSGSHKVSSGKLDLSLTIDPGGSSTLSGPITLSFGGPFQTRGSGKLPESDFTVSAGALGHSVSLGIISTGTTGYVSLQGTSYQMPQATFQKLESSFAQLASSGGSSSGSGTLSKLGIQPLHWLTNPTIVGTENVGGAQTTHIHAGVNVPALLSDLNTVLQRASSLGVSGSKTLKSGLSAATRQKIAAEVKNPSVDVWTGTNDHTIRRLAIVLTLPVTGKASSELGGMSSADISLTMQYSDLNQPQTITAPTTVQPFTEFQAKVDAFVQELEGAAGGLISGGSSSGATAGGGSSTTTSTTGSSSNVQKYSQCIEQAAGDVGKMQKCASLLGSGG